MTDADDRAPDQAPDPAPDGGHEAGHEAGHGTPRSLRQAALLTAVEGVAIIGGGGFWLVRSVLDAPSNLGASLAGAVFAILAGLLLLRLALGISRVEGWSRSPLVALQIVFLPVGFTLAFQADQPVYGVPVLVLCLSILYLLFTPESRLAFFDR